jgi:acyl-CoA dehydrogenase
VGGTGYGIIEQCLVLEEVGRTLAPVPVLASIVMGAMPIAEFGSASQREMWARPAADGEKILTAALAEPLNRDYLRPVTTARREGSGWRLDGIKTCVPAATLADAILISASTPEGPAVFVVASGAPGMTITPQRVSNRDLDGYVELSGVAVGDDALVGSVEQGSEIVEWILERATVGLCATQLGVTEQGLAHTAEYTKTRVQFERAIATFQAVGHRCADAYIDVEAIRMTMWQAAWRLSEALPASAEVAVAKYWAAHGGNRIAHAIVHLHGGMGVATEYFVHRFFLAAKQIEFTLGGEKEQLLRLGSQLAGEPV